MYCVKCGVRLEQGTEKCPLCGTPVWNPTAEPADSHYNSRLYPVKGRSGKFAALSFVTILVINVCLSCLIICLEAYRAVAWSGFVMLGCAAAYVIVVLPMWFSRPHPAIFIPVSFAAIGGYLLYICLATGGHWFLSFAFPCVFICFILSFAAVGLYVIKFRPRTKLLLLGVFFVLLAGCTMLLELFLHITFHTTMFKWSLYTACNFGLIGLFLMVASFIKPLRRYLYKKLFV